VRLVEQAKQQIELETSHAREALRREVATIAVSAASKVLEREINPQTHADLLNKLATQI
jgi:F-type H+-transporting ATPase subunit b